MRSSGLCDTCAVVSKHGVPANPSALAWANQPQAAKLIPYYRWKTASNTRYTVFFGEGSMMAAAVIVIRHTADGDQVIHTRRIGAVERMRGMLGT